MRGTMKYGPRCLSMAISIILVSPPVIFAADAKCCDESSCSPLRNPKQLFQCTRTTWLQLTQTFPPAWYLDPIVANFGMPKQCSQGNRTFLNCTTDSDCSGIKGACVPKVLSPLNVVNKYMACCRHCVWNMQFPMGAPIQVTIGPLKNSSNELFMVPILDCTTFPSEWSDLDRNKDNYLSDVEFSAFFTSLPNRQLVAQGMLNPSMVLQAADLNSDRLLSYEEYVALRHFWTPVLISNSGPAPSTDGSIADGPLGGLFWDEEMVSVWVTTANNILLRLYILNAWNSAATREPLSGEELDFIKNADLDGSGRISLEEHYFRTFADIDGSGELDPTEFALSLYADNLTLANRTRRLARYSFADHDIDRSGTISFLERKRLSADGNLDGAIDAEEWRAADFPSDAEIFQQHASDNGTVGRTEYLYYMMFDYCTLGRWQRYNPANLSTTDFPWNYQACTLTVLAHEAAPFVEAAPARRRRDLVTQSGRALTGYSASVWSTLAARRGFSHTVVLLPGAENASRVALPPPTGTVSGPVAFTLGLFSLFQTPPPEWTCTGSIWPEDGFVILVRAAPSEVNLYLIVLDMVVSPQFVNFFTSLFFLVLAVGHVIWILECWKNELQFRPFYSEGVIDGLWWAIVTQTTNGFGDKAPATLPGKAFAVFWMIFGLITFAIFAGQATSFIATATALNSISDASGLAGRTVGVPAGAPAAQLAQALAFTSAPCAGMAACVRALLAKEVDAVLAPRADTVHHFVVSGLNAGPCGNPVAIVGGTLAPGAVAGLGPSLQLCGHGRGVHAATHLARGIAEEAGRMAADGTLAGFMGDVVQHETVPDTCISPPTYAIPLNAAAAVVLAFYVIGRTVERRMYRQGLAEPTDMGDVAQSLMAIVRQSASGAGGGGDKAAAEEPPPLPELEDVEEFVTVARRVGLFHAMQSGAVRKMQRELRKQKRLLTAVVKLMLYTSASVACGLVMTVGILIAVWSDKIQLAQYW